MHGPVWLYSKRNVFRQTPNQIVYLYVMHKLRRYFDHTTIFNIILYRRFYLSEHRVLVGRDVGGSFAPVAETTTTTTTAAAAAAVAAATTTTAGTTDVRRTILYDNM